MAAFKRLWITEKPDMAKNLAAGLCAAFNVSVVNPGGRSNGYFELSNGDRVTFLFGHMIAMDPVSAYLSEEQNRNLDKYFDILPIIPKEFKFSPKMENRGKPSFGKSKGKSTPVPQYGVVMGLIKSAREIVNAGDIDREGQLIVDELLKHGGLDPSGQHKPVYRLHMVSPREEDIVKELKKPLDRNGDTRWQRKGMAANCRQESDWLVGMNGSMAWQCVTGVGKISVGRVQTPTLALVVRRDQTIANFRAKDFYVPVITMADGTEMRWHQRAGAEGMPGFDEEGRIIDRRIADDMVMRISRGMKGTITKADRTNMKELPPLPFSLGTLQSHAAKEHGMTIETVTKSAQALYEKHKMISYVGTDCQFLPQAMLENARDTMEGLAKIMGKHANKARLDLRSKAWNDNKVDEHYAIIPNGTISQAMNEEERLVFGTIARRYISQFYPAYEYIKNSLQADFGMDEFRASSREDVRLGWKEVEGMDMQGQLADSGEAGEEDMLRQREGVNS